VPIAAVTGQGWGLAVAVGIGILLGAERERHKGRGPSRGSAGVRTFALASLLGALAAQLGTGALVVAVAFVGTAALLGYRRGEDRDQDPGLTTEFALVVTVLLGALAAENAELAAGVGVAVTLLLAERGRLHRLVRDTLSDQELHDGLLVAAAALIVLPLVPDEGLGPHDALNPFTVWRLVVIVMAISGLGYVALRVLGPKKGLPVAGLIGGFVSSTATVAAMAGRARATPAARRPAVAGAVLSTVASLIVTAMVVAAVSVPVLRAIAPALVPAGVAAIAFGGVSLARVARAHDEAPLELGRAFDLKLPLILALVVSATLVLADVLNEQFGSSGLALATALTGFADAHAAAITAATLVAAGRLDVADAVVPILVALTTNSVTKAVLAAGIGGWAYARRVVLGLVLVLAAAWAGAALTLA
jgi:uncharacterized membrane protein (DUF4010 family)